MNGLTEKETRKKLIDPAVDNCLPQQWTLAKPITYLIPCAIAPSAGDV